MIPGTALNQKGDHKSGRTNITQAHDNEFCRVSIIRYKKCESTL